MDEYFSYWKRLIIFQVMQNTKKDNTSNKIGNTILVCFLLLK